MPTATRRNRTNRNKLLKNIQEKATDKEWFRITPSKKVYPGQLIKLYYTNLKNNFPGQILKEIDPKEYLKQKQKLNVTKKIERNKALGILPRRGPGSRGRSQTITTKSNFLAWLEKMQF